MKLGRVEYKHEIFETYPESHMQAQQRGLQMIEIMNKKLVEESENGTKRVCLLVVSHVFWVDELANVFEFVK